MGVREFFHRDSPQAIVNALVPSALSFQRGIPYMTRFTGVKLSGRPVYLGETAALIADNTRYSVMIWRLGTTLIY